MSIEFENAFHKLHYYMSLLSIGEEDLPFCLTDQHNFNPVAGASYNILIATPADTL